LANHGHMLTREAIYEQIARYSIDIFIFGHSHVPELEKSAKSILLNPGSPALSKFQCNNEVVYTAASLADEEIKIFDIYTGRNIYHIPL